MVRTRFAPSPTGFMHVGNLRSALYAYLFAKQNKGTFILRIEDTDLERYVEGAVDVIYETLKQSKIKVDEGPNEGGNYGPYVQSERKNVYLEYALKLVETGHAYYCFCDKERLESIKTDNGIKRYDKHCLNLSKEEIEEKLKNHVPYVIRQNMPTEGYSEFTDMVFGHVSIPNNELEDQILIKSDGMPTYNFANVIDDHLMGITHVIRGNEYLSSTPKYNLLYEAFGWEVPKYMHLTPIMKDETRKLSKRHGDANFDDFINKGYLPEAIINYIALVGWSPKGSTQEKFTMEELIEHFSVEGLSKSPGIFDENKMRWLNGEYIKELSFDDFMKYATPYFEKSSIKGLYSYEKFGKLLQPRIEIFSEIIEKVAFINDFHQIPNELYFNKKLKIDEEKAIKVLEECIPALANIEFTEDNLHEVITNVATKLEYKSGVVYTVLRIALSATQVTPGGSVEIADILGKEESMRRLELALSWLK